MARIIVTLEQIGGFVGYLRKQVDSNDLNPEDAKELEKLVDAAASPQSKKAPGQPIDKKQPFYSLTIAVHDQTYQVLLDPKGMDSLSSDLIKFVQQKGKPLGPP